MSQKTPFQIRVELARGHWALQEYELALASIERAEPLPEECEALANVLREFLTTLENGSVGGEIEARLQALLEPLCQPPAEEPGPAVSPVLATPTMAQLLADQGHRDQALEVAQDVLRRRPDDEDARALKNELQPGSESNQRVTAELERWLQNLRRRRAELGAT